MQKEQNIIHGNWKGNRKTGGGDVYEKKKSIECDNGDHNGDNITANAAGCGGS